MPASTEQKVDFLLKKIGYSASKTGGVEGSSGTVDGTKKKPTEEAIPSPLVIPSTSIWADSSLIPATPPGSDTFPVKVYATASAYRLTVDNTVSESRSFIARSTYGNASSSIDGNWIDSQFGADYAVRVFKGDPNSGGVELAQAGATGNDTWFFDYSSGILNFNGTDNHSTLGVTDTNIYILGYRYTGGIGAKPPTGIGTFSSLNVTGIATFHKDVEFVGAGDAGIKSTFWDQSASSLKFLDNVSAQFGDDQALTIKHNQPGHSYIQQGAGKGDLVISTGVLRIVNAADNANLAAFTEGSNVKLYFDGNQRFTTTGYGVSVSGLESIGISTLTGDVRAGANLSVTGLSTFTQLVDINGGGQADTFKVEDLTQYRVVLAGDGGEIEDNSKLTFDANSNFNVTGGIKVTGVSTFSNDIRASANLSVTGISTLGSIGISTGLISGPATMYIDPTTVGDDTGLLVVKGNLQVDGTQTTVNSSTMTVTDKNIEIAKGAANNAAADGAGITVDAGTGTDKTWTWVHSTGAWSSSEHIRIANDKLYGFSGDTNTYIDRPAADNIRFTTGGSVAITIDENQRLGIGTENPTVPLQINHGSPKIILQDNDNGTDISIHNVGGAAVLSANSAITFQTSDTSEKVRIDSNGKVGIGTYTPETRLHVSDGHLASANDFDSNIVLAISKNTTTSSWAGLALNSGNAAGAFIHFGDTDDSNVGRLDYNHTDNCFSFFTNGSSDERLRITSDGKVGIAQTSPDYELDVTGSIGLTGQVRGLSQSASSPTYSFDGDSDTGMFRGGGVNILSFATGGTERLTIKGDGNTNVAGSLNVTGITTSARLNVTGITTVATLNVGVSGQTLVGINTILDEDDMASNSATALVTQQSLVAYVGSSAPGGSALTVSADSGTNQVITLTTDTLDIEGTANEIETVTGSDKVIIGLPDDVTIANDLTVASNAGIGSLSVTGISTFHGQVSFDNGDDAGKDLQWQPTSDRLAFFNDVKATFGNSATFTLRHNGTNAYIENTSENLVIDNSSGVDMYINSGNDIYIRPQGSDNGIKLIGDGAVELYHNNLKKLETLQRGVGIGGSIHIDNDAYVTGISTFNNDATFVGAASSNTTWDKDANSLKFDDHVKAQFGDGQDLSIYWTGSRAKINSANSNLDIESDYTALKNKDNNREYITCTNGDSVDLFWSGASNGKRFETTQGGTLTTGIATATGVINSQTDVQINGVSVTESALNDAVAMAIALG